METTARATRLDQLEKERRYLEGLLATRINFYLVFVSFYFVAIFGADSGKVSAAERTVAMVFGGAVSLLMGMSVFRTYHLVEHVLDELRKYSPTHPYALAYEKLVPTNGEPANFVARVLSRGIGVSANRHLALLPWGFAVAFFFLALLRWFAR